MISFLIIFLTAVVGLFYGYRKLVVLTRPFPILRFSGYEHSSMFQDLSVPPKNQKILVTGGHGFLGSHLVEALLAMGNSRIVVFDKVSSTLFSDDDRVEIVLGDLNDKGLLNKALKDVDVCFHTAAFVNFWSRSEFDYENVYNVNVMGSRNVTNLCLSNGVKCLVYTSSGNVVFSHPGKNNLHYWKLDEEDIPLALSNPLNHYTYTKALGEAEILSANGPVMKTGSLRPTGIFGPRDLRLGDLHARHGAISGIGKGQNMQDFTYVENCVYAHLLLWENLRTEKTAAGKAFFVSNDEILTTFEFHSRFSALFSRKFNRLPESIMVFIASFLEYIAKLTKGRGLGSLQKFSPSVLKIILGTYVFKIEKAKKILGYKAVYSLQDGMERTVNYYKQFL